MVGCTDEKIWSGHAHLLPSSLGARLKQTALILLVVSGAPLAMRNDALPSKYKHALIHTMPKLKLWWTYWTLIGYPYLKLTACKIEIEDAINLVISENLVVK